MPKKTASLHAPLTRFLSFLSEGHVLGLTKGQWVGTTELTSKPLVLVVRAVLLHAVGST